MKARNLAIHLALLLATSGVSANDQIVGTGPYSIERFTTDSGGGVSSGGEFSIQGTISQSDAGPSLFGAPFGLNGGFWPGLNGSAFIETLFRDRFEAPAPSTAEGETDKAR